MFPQVGTKFFETRAAGPRNLGHAPDTDASQPAVPPVDRRKGPVRSEVVYEVKLNGRSHRVSVAPAD